MRGFRPGKESPRELTLTIRVGTFGTKGHAQAMAERIRSMLGVELHQDVELVRYRQRVRRS